MATKVWKGHLRFGMLTIPVFLNVGAREQKVELHMYHSTCKGSIKKPNYCPACAEMVDPSAIIKGYDTGTGIVPITPDELENISPETEHVMEITECVEWDQVDPVYLAESFYMLPDAVGTRAYSLIVKTLNDTGRVAIAHITKGGREHVVILRPKGNGLMAHYLWYQTEVARSPEFESLKMVPFAANELKAAKDLVESVEVDFKPEFYEDAYYNNLNTLIASKLDSKIQPPAPVKGAAVAATQDLMGALTASLGRVKPRRQIEVQNEKPAKKGKKSKAA